MTTPADSRSCPSPEELALFVEGRSDQATRRRIAGHLTECNECLTVVREAAAYEREEVASAPTPARFWPVAAVLAIGVLTAILFTAIRREDPLRRLAATAADAGLRPFEGRIVSFEYAPFRALRGGPETAGQLAISAAAEGIVQEVKPADAEDWHAVGVAALSLGRNAEAVDALSRATRLTPESSEYQADLAAARVALGTSTGDRGELRRAIADCDRALRAAPRSPAALFNRALALERLGERESAFLAYRAYLAVDGSSPWADEVRWRMQRLRVQNANLLSPSVFNR